MVQGLYQYRIPLQSENGFQNYLNYIVWYLCPVVVLLTHWTPEVTPVILHRGARYHPAGHDRKVIHVYTNHAAYDVVEELQLCTCIVTMWHSIL